MASLPKPAGRLEGTKAVITGSGGGMGGAIAVCFARQGADVVLNDRSDVLAKRLEPQILALGRDVITVAASVTRREGAEAVIGAALERWGRLDVLVNVVGGIKGPIRNPIWDITDDEWDAAVRLNLRGTFLCTQLASRAMRDQGSGKIVNIASTSWADELGLHPHYAAAKAGVVAFTRSVARQLGPYGINVNAIAPGPTRTGHAGRDDDPTADAGEIPPLGRINESDDIADTALFLVTAESRNISGQLLTVAGGLNPSL